MVSEDKVDEDWLRLADVDDATRQAFMVKRYQELAALPEDQRRTRLRGMANAEYSLADDKLQPFTLSRLRSWLALEPGIARVIADSYEAVMQQMPGAVAMRRVATVQTLATAFSLEDESRLRDLVPTVLAARTIPPSAQRAEEDFIATRAPAKKSWWPFGRKGE